ncbi:hypothetical protein [Nonomuraea sp. NPDC005650]|uniref:hypothetical protein n=1 Tax=Nonomuraea sp. NPDC005650 TaxID=3157045 RepID=UPI0033AC8AA4
MSANTFTAPDARHVELVWEASPFAAEGLPLPGISYGYAGNLRAFALSVDGRKVTLRSYLPFSDGKPPKDQPFLNVGDAKERAEQLLELFVGRLFAECNPH